MTLLNYVSLNEVSSLMYFGHSECRTSFPQQAKYRNTKPIELVHGDLCRPITPATSNGNKYMPLLVDDMSQFMWAMLLASKDGGDGNQAISGCRRPRVKLQAAHVPDIFTKYSRFPHPCDAAHSILRL